jgi:hypothetical protein
MNLRLRPALALLATALLCTLLAAGCSPGTGGTGTGPITSNSPELPGTPTANPTATPTTGSLTVTVLVPTVTVPTPTTTIDPGTTTVAVSPLDTFGGSVTYVSTATGSATVTALLQASSIVISQGCGIFSYQGQWAVAKDGSITVRGQYTNQILSPAAPVPTPQDATAVLRISNGGNTATVNVVDAAGNELIVLTVLTRSTAPPAPPNSAGC